MVFNKSKGCLIVAVNLVLIVLGSAQEDKVINKAQPPPISVAVAEHEPSKTDVDPPADKAWQTTTERTLIRVTRLESSTEQPKSNKRQRRQVIEAIQTTGFVISVVKAMQNTESGEEILGMAKKVAIAVIVITSLCTIGCLAITVIICVKCCCRKKERERKPAASVVQVPQPIYVHTGPSGYQPQYHQQQVPQSWNRAGMQSPESRPMLPQPSAPPQPTNHFQIEHPPPPYEKLYTGV